MNERRLIDADVLYESWDFGTKNDVYEYHPSDVLDSIIDCPTVDPETLPIVKELREKLANVTAEKEAAVNCLHACCRENGLCYGCKHWDGSECADTEATYFCEEGGSDMWEWNGEK